MTGILPQTQKDFIKSEIAKDVNGTDELRWCLNNARHNWDYWGFQNERQCELANLKYKIACQIRRYCRMHKLTTRKGSYHSFDCRYEHRSLWYMVSVGDIDWKVDNLRWRWRSVDGLMNLQIWFE